MAVNTEKYHQIIEVFKGSLVTLVAVSKTKPIEDIEALYQLGQRDFGENYTQELVDKQAVLPKDIRWHFIGHLQTNKVKYIAPFVHLIHGVDSLKLLTEINKQAQKMGRVIHCLLQMHIATEETKFGMDAVELEAAISASVHLPYVSIKGLMGMASFSDNQEQVRKEFKILYQHFQDMQSKPGAPFTILSMGMSGDYQMAIEEGATMVRIGSLLFGERNYPTN
ncbi:MAG: YggS family pyridoxal phosphate-dependent enzyme [Chitinophagaceae bacterium]|nr:YggS family pyridoxal phosphate-dependent enzyme [Chitinophagaceae bacterium]